MLGKPTRGLLHLSYSVSITLAVLFSSAATLPVRADISTTGQGEARTYTLTTDTDLRDNIPAGKQVQFTESLDHARLRSGSTLFDGLYALAVHEAQQDSVSQIRDGSYNGGQPIQIQAFETGRLWNYVWTRDLAYATHLALSGFDPQRAANTLFFKASSLKPSVRGGLQNQIVQDTGSGGSYPVSSDRVVWALGVSELLKYLPQAQKMDMARRAYPFLRDTLEQDRRLIFDARDGLYRGEQSFLDWREQTYPLWTRDNVLPIALSKTLSVNAANVFALNLASDLAGRLGRAEERKRYALWSRELKAAINRRFWDAQAGMYSTYLLTDVDSPVRARRYDLLGESLAILLGVASDAQAQQIIRRYPSGAFGPPVVWPQERAVPIYHNHAMWPFVTSYWIKAARQAGNAPAVDRGIESLIRGAASNLSNMENLDVLTGRAQINNGSMSGPVINSQRQVWSVAGYLSMVQDVVFGLETSWDGIRFRPFVTPQLRRTLGASGLLELRDFRHQGKAITVRLHLPRIQSRDGGACRIKRIELNGKKIGTGFVPATRLATRSTWDIFLDEPRATSDSIRTVDVRDERAWFSPAQPEWEGDAITQQNGLLTLRFRHASTQEDAANVAFNIYRDGQLVAQNVRTSTWTDARSGDWAKATRFYSIEAVDARTGNTSHLSPSCCYQAPGAEQVIAARQMENRGGHLVGEHHFEDWGQPDHSLTVREFVPTRSGKYLVRAEYSNGAGPINTGITCAIKKLEIVPLGSTSPVASGYFVMPQMGDWKRFELSSPIRAELKAKTKYLLRLSEDATSRNMSYLQSNASYNGGSGGGESPYNYVNIASLRLLRTGD